MDDQVDPTLRSAVCGRWCGNEGTDKPDKKKKQAKKNATKKKKKKNKKAKDAHSEL